MTLQKDQDPGWWRRGMTRRAQVVVLVVAVVLIVGAFIFVVASGLPIF